jgi:opacity protein-like surface antigen
MRTQILILQLLLVLACAKSFSDAPYQAQTSQQKMDQLWKECTADQTPYGWYSAFSLGRLFFESMKPSFDFYSDVLPEGRNKYIHSVGSVVQAELIPEGENPYTGMFKGVSNVLLRISLAKKPDYKSAPKGNFVPGMGIKLLRDGVPSANLVAMLGVDGQDSFNVFKYDWSNHIPNPPNPSLALRAVAKKFSEVTPYIGRIGLKTWAQYNEKGQQVEDSKLKFPFKLIFRATAENANRFPDTFTDELPNHLKTIPSGTVLYDVLAVEEPGVAPVKIATLKTKSNFVTSKFGDKDLFFQHNWIEDDMKLHPNWQKAYESDPSVLGKLMSEFHK